jgi:hypothetical protein
MIRRGNNAMTTTDGTVLGMSRIVDNGPVSSRFNIVILGDGYQNSEMSKYHTDVQNFVNLFQITAPFDRIGSAINIYRVDVASTDSGADDPLTCGGSGATPRTYFDATFCTQNIARRLLTVNNANALAVARTQVPQVHLTMMIVNSSQYGGSGGAVATFSTDPNAAEIGLHEMGHTAFGLADEYDYYFGCGRETNRDYYPGGEPALLNVTNNINRSSIKWRTLIQLSTLLPTTSNADCTRCEPGPSSVPTGTVGAFVGAYYYHCNCYRSEFNCRMRALNNPFCAACQQVILQTLAPYIL